MSRIMVPATCCKVGEILANDVIIEDEFNLETDQINTCNFVICFYCY